jgi:predicted glycogen debranching enzyme
MDRVIRRMNWAKESDKETLLAREWLVTNGLGGYASGTVAGASTRRYHGLLIAAVSTAHGRMMMFNHLAETLHLPDGTQVLIGSEERARRDFDVHGAAHLNEFRLEDGMPVWQYEMRGTILEKRVLMPYMQNTVHIMYRIVSGDGPVRLDLRPSLHFRPHGDPVETPHVHPYTLFIRGNRYEVSGEANTLRFFLYGEKAALTADGGAFREVFYREEAERGYGSRGRLWSPGHFTAMLSKDKPTTLVASTEEWAQMLVLKPEEAYAAECERCQSLLNSANPAARDGMGRDLVIAADQFLITPVGRTEHETRVQARGQQAHTVIAGYYWFTDWGRDTMISLEGLTLDTGRYQEAGWIIGLFADYIRDGLIPNLFPEGGSQGLYNTADATLWFFHALERYTRITGDKDLLRLLFPKLVGVIQHHVHGTRFNIGVDPADGLLRQGAEGYQLTWMDAKVDGWVVTPRRGKAVEINALWYNALCLMAQWAHEAGKEDVAREMVQRAEKARVSFNKRFWYAEGGYLYDVVDGEHGDDPSCRPNQIFSFSLPHPILDRVRWEPVLNVVKDRLLTPVGLRSLAPGHPDYKSKYFGDLRSRDAAYHQGTVWAWLIGPFIDAWLAVYPGDIQRARKFLDGFENAMNEACLGSISEVFDAESPFTPRGCIAQAWSVAEVLRCWIKTHPPNQG